MLGHFFLLYQFNDAKSICRYYLLGHFFSCYRSSKDVPRLVLPEELFVNIGNTVGVEVNRALAFLQDVAVGGNLKQFLVVCEDPTSDEMQLLIFILNILSDFTVFLSLKAGQREALIHPSGSMLSPYSYPQTKDRSHSFFQQ